MMEVARLRLAVAVGALDTDPSSAISLAYYAMLFAARAALSERDTYAKTHKGVWDRFFLVVVEGEGFDRKLATSARKQQEKREDADYEAWMAPRADAEKAIELARRFVDAVAEMFP
jgi:uncharacterized protein (UPF0332 family)